MSLLMDIQTNRCWARVDFLATGEIVLHIPEECELPIRVLVSRGGRSTEYEPKSSEKPNNCEDLQDWKDRMWAEAIVTEPTCDTCRHKGVEGCEQPCLGCGCCGLYEAMTGNDKLKEKVVEFLKTCARCKHRPIGAMMCEESCHYEPQPTTQTETQNSNLTFEKRTMRDCYNCKRYETEGECVECHYEPKQTDECAKEYEELGLKELKELIEADRKDEPQTDCAWK